MHQSRYYCSQGTMSRNTNPMETLIKMLICKAIYSFPTTIVRFVNIDADGIGVPQTMPHPYRFTKAIIYLFWQINGANLLLYCYINSNITHTRTQNNPANYDINHTYESIYTRMFIFCDWQLKFTTITLCNRTRLILLVPTPIQRSTVWFPSQSLGF